MSKTLQFRRGSTALLNTFAGSDGELFVDTSKLTVVVMDGGTLGGTPLATEYFVTAALLRASTTSTLGTVKIDSTSIVISSGTISVPVGTSSVTGILRPDGTSVLVSSGIISVNTTFGTSISVSGSVIMSSPFMFRNRLYNGNFQFWQRGTTTSTSGTYLADRWIGNNITSYAQSSDVPTSPINLGFNYSAEFASTTLSYPNIGQYIEAAEAIYFVSSQCTVSFWAKNVFGSAGLYVELQYPNSVNTFSGARTIATNQFVATSFTGGWTYYTATFATSNMVTGFANGLAVFIVRDVVSTSSTRVTGIQLELGPVATPFERLPLQQQIALCQRYFELVGGTTGTWQGAYYHQRYKVTKRATPTLSLFNGSVSGANYDNGVDTTNSFRLPGSVTASGAADYTIAANAEL